MELNAKELTQYLIDFRKAIENSQTESFGLTSDIEFELGVFHKTNKEGGFDLYVFDIKGKDNKEGYNIVKFKMGFRPPSMTR